MLLIIPPGLIMITTETNRCEMLNHINMKIFKLIQEKLVETQESNLYWEKLYESAIQVTVLDNLYNKNFFIMPNL